MINWSVRFKNKYFWLGLIPAGILVVTKVAALFGYHLDLGDLQEHLLDLVAAVFTLYSAVLDPTTAGTGDSVQALSYTEPKASE